MSPFSMARMSGRSRQSVRGTVPSASPRSSFSCMAKAVKLYICQQRGETHFRTATRRTSREGAPVVPLRPSVTPVPSSRVWLRFATAAGCRESPPRCLQAGRAARPRPEEPDKDRGRHVNRTTSLTGSCTTLLDRRRLSPDVFHHVSPFIPGCRHEDGGFRNGRGLQFLPLYRLFSPLPPSCCFSYEPQRQQDRWRTDTLSTSRRERTASFCCKT